MREITIYTSLYCGYCSAAKQLLSSRGYKYEEINMQGDEELMIEVMQKSGQRTVPQIFVGDCSVGGYQELLAAVVNDDFEELVNPVG
ncbi:MAG: glutaredoxin 3 [Gammaproteobacteria bacterium]|jgi:glutaredoxin 3|nr:glutaredoxin 3 [Gammaproteobacteria bacterium]|tara:strand:- start:1318 stop:1578 length:261 start_codon:yes stop_codon:yes gene_type:complete